MKQLAEANSSGLENQELHTQRLEIVNLEVELNEAKEKIVILSNQVEYMR
jgi:hypothetical protein